MGIMGIGFVRLWRGGEGEAVAGVRQLLALTRAALITGGAQKQFLVNLRFLCPTQTHARIGA